MITSGFDGYSLLFLDKSSSDLALGYLLKWYISR